MKNLGRFGHARDVGRSLRPARRASPRARRSGTLRRATLRAATLRAATPRAALARVRLTRSNYKGPPHPLSTTVAPFQAWRGLRCAVGGPGCTLAQMAESHQSVSRLL